MQPTSFSNLPALFYSWRQSLQPLGRSDGELPESVPVVANPAPPKSIREIILQKLRPNRKRGFRLNIKKNTIFTPGDAPQKPYPANWFNGHHSRPIYALIIGVDNYQHLPNLYGAVNDANAFSRYLKTDLKVPAESIVELRNEQATRAQILRAFHALGQRSERRPRKDDSIIIYYAGYGGPFGASVDGIQTIIPTDYSTALDNAIPPVTSAELLDRLAEVKRVKGDHITIIFDCGGSQPEGEGGTNGSRVVALPETSIDAGRDTSDRAIISGNVFVISACSRGEVTREIRGRGVFTNTLIKVLKREGSSNTTRANILTRLPQITSQTPQVYGGATEFPIFSTGLSPPEEIAYPITMEREQYAIHAGSIAGITPGTRFSVYRDRSRLSSKKPKTFIADRISLFTTTLKPIGSEPLKPLLNLPAAIVSSSGQRHDLVVYTPIKNALTPLYQIALKLMYESSADSYLFFFTEDRDNADIALDVSEGGDLLQITSVDERVALHGYKEIPATVHLKNDEIERFLLNAAHFYRQLNHCQPNHTIGNDVSVEFLRLLDSDTHYDDYGHPYRYPVGSNLFANGVVEVEVDPEEPDNYGFRITNNTEQDLYVHVFYFDNSDLTITKYHPLQDLEQTAIAKHGGVMTIGYDNPGSMACTYFVREGQDVDVGFVKVMFSTEPIELSSIPQKTIYQEVEPAAGKQKEAEVKVLDMPSLVPAADQDLEKVWGSIMYSIVQRRVGDDADSMVP